MLPLAAIASVTAGELIAEPEPQHNCIYKVIDLCRIDSTNFPTKSNRMSTSSWYVENNIRLTKK
jgi:hypothetical protein